MECALLRAVAGLLDGDGDKPDTRHVEGGRLVKGRGVGGSTSREGGMGSAHVHDLHVGGELDSGVGDGVTSLVGDVQGDGIFDSALPRQDQEGDREVAKLLGLWDRGSILLSGGGVWGTDEGIREMDRRVEEGEKGRTGKNADADDGNYKGERAQAFFGTLNFFLYKLVGRWSGTGKRLEMKLVF